MNQSGVTSLKHLNQDVSRLHKLNTDHHGRVREELVSYWLVSDLSM